MNFKSFPSIPNASFFCQLCSYISYKRIDYVTHVISHSEAQSSVCPVCKKVFSSKSNLRTHVLVHSEFPFMEWKPNVAHDPYLELNCNLQFNPNEVYNPNVEVNSNQVPNPNLQLMPSEVHNPIAEVNPNDIYNPDDFLNPDEDESDTIGVSYSDFNPVPFLHNILSGIDHSFSCQLCTFSCISQRDFINHTVSHCDEQLCTCPCCKG
ncbi:hypothetical protein JTE90_009442 [Oedothorax gibbosus]|uniref:C2H2-type domain-containing protein n=1 Tax=Oedothorax gibbosus TaxID=931172 RepID=A0AAV6VV07_9ARAC|nr:hypothetical protein JTE90_009442 [Oedothorax gibbosus]